MGDYSGTVKVEDTGGVNVLAVDVSGAAKVVNATLANQAGAWAYYAGSSGTVTVTAGQRVLGIAAHATTAGTMTINSGNSIPVPANSAITITPLGNLVAPSVTFSGTDSYFVEVVS